jgi:hypothetical protein
MYPVKDIAARFARGKTYSAYLMEMQKNRETIAAISKEIRLSEDDQQFFREALQQLGPIKVLVISEDWCPDCALNVPVLMQVAALGAVEVRFFKKEEADDIHTHALKGDRKAIPTFICFDANWNEVGQWLERPAKADLLLAEWDQTHPNPAEPDRTAPVWKAHRAARSAYRDALFFQQGLWRETIHELRLIVSQQVFNNQLVMAQAH